MPRDAGVDSVDRIDVDERDGIVQRLHMPQTQTAWNVIYTALKRALLAGVVHAGESFERLEQADPLVGADGGRSSARAQLLPDARPAYAGYVAWRGLVDECERSEPVLRVLRERFTFQQGNAHLFLTYLEPGRDVMESA
ncbi:hypothetical protein [Burkholderia ubonensis]|uniref:FAD binding domain-containing protein n=1 Tax=Burkholderia ubonensis TaxID=101571 RepID=UPI000AFB2939|nr:hypothetical protein [Burkholderia ubonensis]